MSDLGTNNVDIETEQSTSEGTVEYEDNEDSYPSTISVQDVPGCIEKFIEWDCIGTKYAIAAFFGAVLLCAADREQFAVIITKLDHLSQTYLKDYHAELKSCEAALQLARERQKPDAFVNWVNRLSGVVLDICGYFKSGYHQFDGEEVHTSPMIYTLELIMKQRGIRTYNHYHYYVPNITLSDLHITTFESYKAKHKQPIDFVLTRCVTFKNPFHQKYFDRMDIRQGLYWAVLDLDDDDF